MVSNFTTYLFAHFGAANQPPKVSAHFRLWLPPPLAAIKNFNHEMRKSSCRSSSLLLSPATAAVGLLWTALLIKIGAALIWYEHVIVTVPPKWFTCPFQKLCRYFKNLESRKQMTNHEIRGVSEFDPFLKVISFISLFPESRPFRISADSSAFHWQITKNLDLELYL